MRFALLGDHGDGLDMARALADSGRHEVMVYSGPAAGLDYLGRWGLQPPRVNDLEEILADPAVEAVIVATRSSTRPDVLRRALQSERHVLCVHPLDQKADAAYEAAMIQADTHCILLPLLPEIFHPGIGKLAEIAWRVDEAALLRRDEERSKAASSTGHLVEMEFWSTEEVVLAEGPRPNLPGWEILRFLGGEIREVFALTPEGEINPAQPVLLTGQYMNGGMFRTTFFPGKTESRRRLAWIGPSGQMELFFPQGYPGPARLIHKDATGSVQEWTWDTYNPWPTLVEAFERGVASVESGAQRGEKSEGWRVESGAPNTGIQAPALHSRRSALHSSLPVLTWQDEVRCLELDDAAHRSAAYGRVSTLDYQDATEEAGFKGTMTLLGCGLIWVSLILLIMSVWVPWLGMMILPIFGLFLLMQFLRWLVPAPEKMKEPDDGKVA